MCDRKNAWKFAERAGGAVRMWLKCAEPRSRIGWSRTYTGPARYVLNLTFTRRRQQNPTATIWWQQHDMWPGHKQNIYMYIWFLSRYDGAICKNAGHASANRWQLTVRMQESNFVKAKLNLAMVSVLFCGQYTSLHRISLCKLIKKHHTHIYICVYLAYGQT